MSSFPPATYPGPPAPRYNALAIVAFIMSFFVAPAAIVCGHIALSQIRRTNESGHGLALAGTIIGYVFTGLGFLALVGYIVFALIFVSAFAAFPHGLTSTFSTP